MMDHILYQLIFKHSDVILLSKYLYVDIQKYVLERNVHYCPNGIPELNRIEEKGNKSKKITLLFLSNMIVSKGIYILLDACKLLKEKHLDFLCNIIGAETQEISNNVLIEEIKKRDLLDYVEYHGAKYGNEKLLYITLSDIFVSPTYDDCFPLTLVEAMQHSLPVISTFEGGIPDIVINGKTGFLCQQQDAQELADKIQILIEDKDLRVKMGKNGYGHYKNNFTLKHFESNLLKILSAIC
jgi:glycosyltransferase involved in cell wall biosynthesis